MTAGSASRLRPLTDNLPKSLIRIGEHALLKRTLDALARNGVEEYIIVTGFCADQIVSFVSLEYPGISVSFVHNTSYACTGNAYSLWLAGRHVRNRSFILLDGDILFPPELVARLCDDPHQDALMVRMSDTLGEEEVKVCLDGRGMVRTIGKEIPIGLAAGESLGIEKFSANTSAGLFAVLDRRKDRNEFYEASFQEMIDAGLQIHAVATGGLPCMEIDTLDDLALARALAADHRL
jgi:choline kinase